MFEQIILISLILILSSIQSIIGVGILVLGTPILLILNYDIISILSILIPASILTSLINLVIMRKYLENINIILKKKN